MKNRQATSAYFGAAKWSDDEKSSDHIRSPSKLPHPYIPEKNRAPPMLAGDTDRADRPPAPVRADHAPLHID